MFRVDTLPAVVQDGHPGPVHVTKIETVQIGPVAGDRESIENAANVLEGVTKHEDRMTLWILLEQPLPSFQVDRLLAAHTLQM